MKMMKWFVRYSMAVQCGMAQQIAVVFLTSLRTTVHDNNLNRVPDMELMTYF